MVLPPPHRDNTSRLAGHNERRSVTPNEHSAPAQPQTPAEPTMMISIVRRPTGRLKPSATPRRNKFSWFRIVCLSALWSHTSSAQAAYRLTPRLVIWKNVNNSLELIKRRPLSGVGGRHPIKGSESLIADPFTIKESESLTP